MCTDKDCVKESCPEKSRINCPCPKTSCENHGLCCRCVAAHISRGKKPPHCLEVFFKTQAGGGEDTAV